LPERVAVVKHHAAAWRHITALTGARAHHWRQPAHQAQGESALLELRLLAIDRGVPARYQKMAAVLRIVWGLRGVPGYAEAAARFVGHRHGLERSRPGDRRLTPTFDVDAVFRHWDRTPIVTGGVGLRDRALTAIAISSACARQAETTRMLADVEMSVRDADGRPADPVPVTASTLAGPVPPNLHALFFYAVDKGALARADGKRVPLVVLRRGGFGDGQPTHVLWQYLRRRGLEPGPLFPNTVAADGRPLRAATVSHAIGRVLQAAGVDVGTGRRFTARETRKAGYTSSRAVFGDTTAKAMGRWAPGSDVPERHYARETWRGIATYPAAQSIDSSPRSIATRAQQQQQQHWAATVPAAPAGSPGGHRVNSSSGALGLKGRSAFEPDDDDDDDDDDNWSGGSGYGPIP
jgi:hypothetical protein